MYKEFIICVIVIMLVIGGNIITQNNTKQSIEELNSYLAPIRQELLKENVDQKQAKYQMKETWKIWKKQYQKMAYYIEHDELEKVETELTKLNANIQTKEYATGVENLENCTFILEHIKDKSALKIVNLF